MYWQCRRISNAPIILLYMFRTSKKKEWKNKKRVILLLFQLLSSRLLFKKNLQTMLSFDQINHNEDKRSYPSPLNMSQSRELLLPQQLYLSRNEFQIYHNYEMLHAWDSLSQLLFRCFQNTEKIWKSKMISNLRLRLNFVDPMKNRVWKKHINIQDILYKLTWFAFRLHSRAKSFLRTQESPRWCRLHGSSLNDTI